MKLLSLPLIILLAVPVSLGFLPGQKLASPTNSGLKANEVMLFRAVPFEIRPGEVLRLEGSGFSKTFNKVYFGDSQSINTISQDGTSLLITVPKKLPLGEYQLSVRNSYGLSGSDFPVLVKVTDRPRPAPEILSASLSGETITLVGNHFTSKNYILTNLGELPEPLSASGNQLSFAITNLSLYAQAKDSLAGKKYPFDLWVFVRSEHGVSQEAYLLKIDL